MTDFNGPAGDHEVILQELQQLGFSEQDAETAVNSLAQPSLATCLDWLCLHIPEEELPTAFAPGMLTATSQHRRLERPCDERQALWCFTQ